PGRPGAVDEAHDPLEVAVVDDPGVVGAPRRVVPVHGADGVGQPVDELVVHRLVDEHVVGGDAGLAGVQQLPPGDAPGGDVDAGAAVDDHRRLAAELERDRREVLGGRPG